MMCTKRTRAQTPVIYFMYHSFDVVADVESVLCYVLNLCVFSDDLPVTEDIIDGDE